MFSGYAPFSTTRRVSSARQLTAKDDMAAVRLINPLRNVLGNDYGDSLPVDVLERVPLEELLFTLRPHMRGWRPQPIHYKVLMDAGTFTPAANGVFRAFGSGRDKPYTKWNQAVIPRANEFLTNLYGDGGRFAANYAYIATGLTCRLCVYPRVPTAYGVVSGTSIWNGTVTNPVDAAAGSQITGYNMTALAEALTEQIGFALRFGEDYTDVHGTLAQLPSPRGLVGNYGGQTTEGVVNNFVSDAGLYGWQNAVVFPTLQDWSIDLFLLSDSLVIPVNCWFELALNGYLCRSTDYNLIGTPVV